MTNLSVIVPCYNCADTLAAAVASIYSQDVSVPFDVTMVDDGSTDGTFECMKKLAGQHSNIRLVQHASNLGGGAARNTAVANTMGDLIFCLDADDMLGAGFLRTITEFWSRKHCDAVGMSTSVKFRGSNTKNVAYVSEYEGPGKRVRFESFLEGPYCSLDVVFLMTRRAFGRVGGYPTEHGLDTQGMGFRFLCNGLTAYTCPGTVYYHRVEHHQSYYLREQSADRLNWNWFNLLDEFLYIFNSEIRSRILGCDLFSVPGKPTPPNLSKIVYGRPGIYAPNYRALIRLGRDGVARRYAISRDGFSQYWLGAYCSSKGQYDKAISHFQRALRLGFDHRIIYYRMLAAALGSSQRPVSTADALSELVQYSQPYPVSRLPLRQRMFRRLIADRLLRRPALLAKSGLDYFRHRRFK